MIRLKKFFSFLTLLLLPTYLYADIYSIPDSLPGVKELQEIIVKRKKEKYSKKNNPAVDFVNKLRKQSSAHDPQLMPFYNFDKYEKIILGTYINEHTKPDSTIQPFIDYSPISGQQYVTLTLKEKLSSSIHANEPHTDTELITAYRSIGIDESFDEDNMRKIIDDVLREVNVYSNDIPLLQQRFVSPLSKIGPDFYKYYLTDTVIIGQQPCIELVFGPHNRESMGFSGKIYIPLGDTTMFVKKIIMQTPKAANINFVDGLYLVQNFVKDSLGYRHKEKEYLTVNIGIIPGKPTIIAHKEIINKNFSFLQHDYIKTHKEKLSKNVFLPSAYKKSDNYWKQHRFSPLTTPQDAMPLLMPSLRKKKWFYWSEKIISIMEKGYIKTAPNSCFDIGPLNTFLSFNEVEGLRLRLGGLTTANLSPNLFLRGYVAYGTRDKKWKYQAMTEYSFTPKKYYSREFPMHLLRAEYNYDLDHIGQHYNFTNADNFFLSFTRKKSILVTYRQLAAISYIYEHKGGLSLESTLRWQRQHSTKWLQFITSSGHNIPFYNQVELNATIRYAPGEEFYQSASMRRPVNMDAPIFNLSLDYGPKHFLGADFTMIKTEVSIMKRFWLSAFGYIDAIFKGAKIWSKVYYPALTWANANLSYTIQPESYSLMNPMEFATDQFVGWDFTYWGNGILFNRLPIIKKAKLREVLTFKGYYGALTKRNNPLFNEDLPSFPTDAYASSMKHGPYMELGIGLDNIFRILRVDYIWRLTYRNTPHTDKSGLRISLHFSF